MLDVTRDLYNAALQQRRDAWRHRQVTVLRTRQDRELTALRDADSRVAAVFRECEDAVLWRLDLAMKAYFRRCERGESPGYPRFKPANRWRHLHFPHGQRALKFKQDQRRIYVPNVGTIKLRKGRAVPDKFGRGWIVERNGRWYLCVEYEITAPEKRPISSILGVDRGVHVLAATSNGELIRNRAVGERRKASRGRLQRALDAVTLKDDLGRCLNPRDPVRVGALKRYERSREREANARRDYAHKVSRRLVDAADCIALERLKVVNMTRSAKGTVAAPGRNVRAKSAMNRVVLDSGFGLLQRMIAYKAESAGVTVVGVDRRFSSQSCYKCGCCDRGNRRRRRFACQMCGFKTHADIAAALEIRRRAQKALSSEPSSGRESRSSRHAHVGLHFEPMYTPQLSQHHAI